MYEFYVLLILHVSNFMAQRILGTVVRRQVRDRRETRRSPRSLFSSSLSLDAATWSGWSKERYIMFDCKARVVISIYEVFMVALYGQNAGWPIWFTLFSL